MPDKSFKQLQVLPYAPRTGGVRWRPFIIGAIMIWLLLLVLNGINTYRHKDDPPDDLGPLNPVEACEIGAALITVAYVLVLGVVVAAVKFNRKYRFWKQTALPAAPPKPDGQARQINPEAKSGVAQL